MKQARAKRGMIKLAKETLSLMWFRWMATMAKLERIFNKRMYHRQTDTCNHFSKETIIHDFLRRYNLWSEHQQSKDETKHFHWWRMYVLYFCDTFKLIFPSQRSRRTNLCFRTLLKRTTPQEHWTLWNTEIWSLKLNFWFYRDFGEKIHRFQLLTIYQKNIQ